MIQRLAFTALCSWEALLDALFGQHCDKCRVPTRVYPRDVYAHNLKRHRL